MPKKGEVLNNAPSPAITERKRMEETLQESEEWYRDLLENANDLIQSVVPDGHFHYVNKTWRKVLGYSEEEVANLTLWDIIHPDSIPHCREFFQKVISGETVNDIEAVFVAKDGRLVTVEGSANCRFKGGEPLATRGIFRDITERKQTEEALRKSEEKYRVLLTNLPQKIFHKDRDSIYVACNDNYARDLKINADEIIGKKDYDFFPKELAEKYRADDRRIVESGRTEEIEERYVQNGQEQIVHTVKTPIKDENGNVIGILGIFSDITERKQAQEALRKAEEDWRNSFNSLEDVMIIIDKDYNIENINDCGLALLEKSREEVIGRKCYQVIDDRDSPPEECPCKLALKTKQVESVDLYEERFGKYFSIKSSPIFDEKGEIVKFVDLRRDITERKRVERELQEKNEQLDAQNEELQSQSEELMSQQQELMEKTREVEKANRLKSDFLANMSHELRTPLNVIIGFSELMTDEVPGKINKEQRQCLSDVLNSSKHLLNLINDVLDLSKIESGKVELKLENVTLTEIIESVTRTMVPILRLRKQSLDIEIEERFPLVYADEGKLGQVLLNLVDNATKFTPDGGKLKIEAARDGDWCQVSVIDNGTGIKKEDQERIFEPFTQIDVLPGENREGTGLGLALTKQLVEMCGGKIWVESEYEKGSRFIFTVPLATNGQPNPEEGNK